MLWPAKGRVRWSLGLGAAPTRAEEAAPGFLPGRGARHPSAWQGQSQLGSRPSTALTQAASPWKLQRRPGEVGAETQRGRGRGRRKVRLFQAFPGVSSLVASSSHRLLDPKSTRFCPPPHYYRPLPPDCRPSRPRCAAGRGDSGTPPPGCRRRLHPPSRPPPQIPHPPSGPGPPGANQQALGSHGGGPAAVSHARKRDLPWGLEAGYLAAIAKGLG